MGTNKEEFLPRPHSFCLFVEDYKSMLTLPMEPLYCLRYPIHFFNDMPADLRNQLHMDLFPPSLCCWECVCCWLIQWANLHKKWGDHHGCSRFLLPHGAQYDYNPLPQLIRPQKPPHGPRHGPALCPGRGGGASQCKIPCFLALWEMVTSTGEMCRSG